MSAARVLSILLTITGFAYAQPLRALYDAHQWFELRDAIRQTDAPPLYWGATEYAFNRLRQAERDLRWVAKFERRSDDAMDALGILAHVAQMQGNYRRALSEIRKIQRIAPDNPDLARTAAFFTSLAGLPRQKVETREASSLQYSMQSGRLVVPITVNRRPAAFVFDTGSNFSVMSESEAKRLGLRVRDAVSPPGTNTASKDAKLSIAVASRVAAGSFVLRNVVFLVVRDDQPPFSAISPSWRGVLGMPVAMAFETIRWTAAGRFELGFYLPRASIKDSNLCFDGADPLVRADSDGTPVTLFLDTGVSKSRLTPAFGRDFPEAVQGPAKFVSTAHAKGVAANPDTGPAHEFALKLGGHLHVLKSPEMLKLSGSADKPFHVWAGMDLFEGARSVTIDFRSMHIAVE